MNKLVLLEYQTKYYGDPSPGILHEYSVQPYFKSNFFENDIFTVHFNNGHSASRMGWLFPVLAIGSDSHDYSEDVHFAHYAKIAAAYAEQGLPDEVDENTHLLILKDNFLVTNDIFIDNFDIALMKYGYYKSTSNSVYSNKYFSVDYKTTNKIIVNKTPRICNLNSYVNKLLLDVLPTTKENLARFICIYQVIEMLMEHFYNNKIDDLRSNRNTIGTIREKMQEFSSERKLLSGLFTEYLLSRAIDSEESDLVQKIFTTYKNQNYYTNLTLPNLIYDIRNVIVHNYYKYELETLMIDISDTMEKIIIEIFHCDRIFPAIAKKV